MTEPTTNPALAAAQQTASASVLIATRLQGELADLRKRVEQLEAHVSTPPLAGSYEKPSIAARSLALGVVVGIPGGVVPAMILEVIASALRGALGDDAACIQRALQITHEPPAAIAVRLGLADEATLAKRAQEQQ